jgi:hypothetical protein
MREEKPGDAGEAEETLPMISLCKFHENIFSKYLRAEKHRTIWNCMNSRRLIKIVISFIW